MTDLMLQFRRRRRRARRVSRARWHVNVKTARGKGGSSSFERNAGASTAYTTSIETHQRDRVTMERWASGLTRVYAEGALSRARSNSARSQCLSR